MGHEYKISLITPVYNAEQYLHELFQSVRTQTIGFESIEWLLIDDCSTDNSYEQLLRWQTEHQNIKVLRTSGNTGTPAEPRNIGLDNASAPYVMFLDNDDAFFSNGCKALYDAIESSGTDIATGDVALMNKKEFTKDERKELLNYSDNLELGVRELTFPLGKFIVPYLNNHWCKIYRRDIIEQNHIRCLKGELWEDILFLFQYLTCVKTMIHISEPIVKYRVRRESLSHVHSKEFYCSLPKSIDYGVKCMESIDSEHARKYTAFLSQGGHIEYYIDCLMNADEMSKEDIADCVLAWKPCFLAANKYDGLLHSAYCKILKDDFVSNEDDKAVFHFFTLRELYKQRKQELNNIFSSSTYRFASHLAGIKEKFFKR